MRSKLRYEYFSARKCNVCVALGTQLPDEELPLSKEFFTCDTDVDQNEKHRATPPAQPLPCILKHEDTDFKQLTTTNLQKCTGCHLIFYCNYKHQRLDWPIHREFCMAVQKIMANLKLKHPLIYSDHPKSDESINNAILKLKFMLRAAMDRPLSYHEEELTSFPAYCAVCFSVRTLKHCPDCEGVSYCSDQHYVLHRRQHKEICHTMQIYYTPFKAMPQVYPTVLEYQTSPRLHSMNLTDLVEHVTMVQVPPLPTESYEQYQYFLTASDYSCMATVLYAMEYMDMRSYHNSKFVLFVVGATVEQELWFREPHQRLFFLQNPRIMALDIFFIGPEVEDDRIAISTLPYMDANRTITLRTFRLKFEEFVALNNARPSMMVAFNCGFAEFAHFNSDVHLTGPSRHKDNKVAKAVGGRAKKQQLFKQPTYEHVTRMSAAKDLLVPGVVAEPDPALKDNPWRLGILSMLETYRVPIVFTSFTEMEAEFDFGTVMQIGESDRMPMRVDRFIDLHRNPFADLRPLRKWNYHDSEEFYYRNGYIQAVRTRLDTPNDFLIM